MTRLGRVMVPIWPAEKRLEGMGSLLCITLKILKPSVAGQQRTLHYIEPTRKTQGPSRGFSLIGSKHSPCRSPGRKNTRRWAGSSGPRPRRPCDTSPPTTVRPPPRPAEIDRPPPASGFRVDEHGGQEQLLLLRVVRLVDEFQQHPGVLGLAVPVIVGRTIQLQTGDASVGVCWADAETVQGLAVLIQRDAELPALGFLRLVLLREELRQIGQGPGRSDSPAGVSPTILASSPLGSMAAV